MGRDAFRGPYWDILREQSLLQRRVSADQHVSKANEKIFKSWLILLISLLIICLSCSLSGRNPPSEGTVTWLPPTSVQKTFPLASGHRTSVTTEKGPAEARQHAQALLSLWGLLFNMGHVMEAAISASLMSRDGQGQGCWAFLLESQETV